MVQNFFHSGATGDIIFSLPTIKLMGGGSLYISKYDEQRALSIAKLIEKQPYIRDVNVVDGPPNKEYVNLNLFRNYAGHHKNLVEAHLQAQGLSDESWRNGWLELETKNPFIYYTYSIINTGSNYLDPDFDWSKEVKYLESISEFVYFLGYKNEYDVFQEKFKTNASFLNCDFLGAAELIKHAVMFTGGYSALSTIAMGLGREYRLVQAPGHTCSSLLMDREKIINI